MDKQRLGLIAAIALMCGLALLLSPEGSGQAGDVGAMGLIALALIGVVMLLRAALSRRD